MLRTKQFNLDQMVPYPSILIIGKRGSGKSYVIDNILRSFTKKYAHADISIISPTERMNPFYKHRYPNATIKYDIENNFLKEIIYDSSIAIEEKSNKNKILVLDDCLYRKKAWAKDELIREIIMNGRHYRIPYILTRQFPTGDITPDLRSNFDYVFLLRDDSTINKKKLWDNYASMFPSLHTFENFFNECTKDYNAMVIDNRKPCVNINEKIFQFKAKLYNDEKDLVPRNNEIFLDPFDQINKEYDDTASDTYVNYIIPNKLDESTITNKLDEPIEKYNSCLKINYHDDNYNFSLSTDNLNNHAAIKILCDHVVSLKNIKIEYMKLINENLRLELAFNKNPAE